MHVEHVTSSRTAELEGARADFLASLARRLGTLRDRLELLAESPESGALREGLLRRLSAMAAAAKVLGFAEAADALEAAQDRLSASIATGTLCSEGLEHVRKSLEVLPSLAWGAPASLPSRLPNLPETVAPGTVLVYGDQRLGHALKSELPNLELEIASTPADALERCRALEPDAIVVDADSLGAGDALRLLSCEGGLAAAGLVVVGQFDGAPSAGEYLALGAVRALPKPAGPEALRRALLEAFRSVASGRAAAPDEPIGEVTVQALAERVTLEVRRGLLDAVVAGGESKSVALADGAEVLAAVWGAVARVREVVTLRSQGAIRFKPNGPEGAVPLAGWSAPERAQGVRGTSAPAEHVALHGRRAIVVDDDPAVVWFLAGLLGSVGFEVLEAHDGRRALDLCWLSWPDLVISDVLMPGLDGFSLCREIKRDVAVRDTPVILLSWKEDLLQRLSELGATADAYLRKEASTALFVERAREVLLPRARLEGRLRNGGEARGRLDGLTPRLVLELAGQIVRDARVSVKDAVHLYEIEIRDGSPRCITRTSLDGSFERGERVLGPLLGIGAGRFAVEPCRGSCREDFDGSLQEVLAPAIRMARAATRALSADQLWQIQRIGLETSTLAAYLKATPADIVALVERIAAGTPPRELIAEGVVSPAILEAVLADVARRGAVRSVEARDGTDLLEQARLGRGKSANLAESQGSGGDVRGSDPRFSIELSPSPGHAEASEPAAASCGDLPEQDAVPTAGSAAAEVLEEESSPCTDAGGAQAPGAGDGATASSAEGNGERVAMPDMGGRGGEEVSSPGLTVKRVAFPGRRAATSFRAGESAAVTDAEHSAGPVAVDAVQQEPTTAAGAASDAAAPSVCADAGLLPRTRKVVFPSTVGTKETGTASNAERAGAGEQTPSSGAEAQASGPVPQKPPAATGLMPEARPIVFPVRGPEGDMPSGAESCLRPDEREESAAVVTDHDRAPTRQGWAGTLRVTAITVGAALASFLAVSQIVAQKTGDAPEAAASARAVGGAAQAAPSSSAASSPAPSAKIEDLPLPVGIDTSPGQGLLEVVTREREAIYVQDTFMGTGPVRPVLLSAGPHQVRVSSDGQSRRFDVNVVPGRRTRLDVSGP